jgi:hypothetical protein
MYHEKPRTTDDVIRHLGTMSMSPLPAPAYTPNGDGKIALAVEGMRRHITDEGWQLMEGLECAGYRLFGKNLPDNYVDVHQILRIVSPDTIVMQDKREWDPRAKAKDPSMQFLNVQALRESPAFKLTIIKDAHQRQMYHAESATEIGAHAWITYYHPKIVCHLAKYVRPEHLIRTYHTVDADIVPLFQDKRRGCLLSGAIGRAYPLRNRLLYMSKSISHCDVLPHPGYNTPGPFTPDFLKTLSQYKVAVCTSSIYGYALRKIIEATACGCMVLTDLPVDDVLPEIDENLARIHPDWRFQRICRIINEMYQNWDPDRQRERAERAKKFYDYVPMCERLAQDIERLRLHGRTTSPSANGCTGDAAQRQVS